MKRNSHLRVIRSDVEPEHFDTASAIAALGAISLEDHSLKSYLQLVGHLTQRCIAHGVQVSISLIGDGSSSTVATTGDAAATLDGVQHKRGWGPCLDAAQTGNVVVVDTTKVNEYSDFSSSARRLGIRNVVTVGFPLPLEPMGSLNVYSPEWPLDGQASLLETFACYAGMAIANAKLSTGSRVFAERMRNARLARARIEQAKGILMARLDCTAEEATGRLTQASQDTGSGLSRVADHVIRDRRMSSSLESL